MTPRGLAVGAAVHAVRGSVRSGSSGESGISRRGSRQRRVNDRWWQRRERRAQVVKTASSTRTIAFLGDYLPRKCGIATFTSDLLGAVAARHPQSRCFAVPVNDIEGCYQYPAVVRFEIEEQDLESYRCAADFQIGRASCRE